MKDPEPDMTVDTSAMTNSVLPVDTTILGSAELLAGYDAVCALYPHVPPLSHWRAWEYAAYRRFRADGRTLDLGCGDGRYFRLIWPRIRDVPASATTAPRKRSTPPTR